MYFYPRKALNSYFWNKVLQWEVSVTCWYGQKQKKVKEIFPPDSILAWKGQEKNVTKNCYLKICYFPHPLSG